MNPARTRSKYGVRTDAQGKAKRTVDGITFHSQHEAKVYGDLKILEKAGKISNLKLQVPFLITIGGVLVCTFRADFVFIEDGEPVVADAKGYRTPEYKLKRKLMWALHNISIVEL